MHTSIDNHADRYVCITDGIYVNKWMNTITYNIEGMSIGITAYKHDDIIVCKGAYKNPSRGVGG